MTRCLPILLVLGCSFAPGRTPQDQTCADIDRQAMAWSTVGIVGGAIGTTASTAIPIADEFADDDDRADWNLGLGITAAVGGGLSLLGTLMQGEIAEWWDAHGCGGSEQ
jgi:hypothetical protein